VKDREKNLSGERDREYPRNMIGEEKEGWSTGKPESKNWSGGEDHFDG